ncbi:protein EXORDIUM-like 2 [Telopea speciosissima]|uniref:protein EXORDIUM-like 2 n=1 Tax=Telopea speciosissima TaxID=54955 RepID=UPI001CC38AF0|nr:protein EXORDIUM-like 2 [Telopea speciosissima]
MASSPLSILSLTILSLVLLPRLGSSKFVDLSSLPLKYHGGPLLTGNLKLAILWYGNFGRVHKQTITTFVKSLNSVAVPTEPSVATWWRTIESYQPTSKGDVSPKINVQIVKKITDKNYSIGKIITQDFIQKLVQLATGGDKSLLPVIFTAKDVSVVGLCMGKCSEHGTVGAGKLSQSYIIVGNPEIECPGTCAWPFQAAAQGPKMMPLPPPSGNVGADSMVLGFASALAGVVTNPYNTGYFLGPPAAPLEAVTACPGKFGSGALPGYMGKVRIDPADGGAFNAHGIRNKKFLLPAVWNPKTASCWTLL